MDKQEKTCFVIMPISDQEGYSEGHYTRVYEHIIKPACKKAGFKPIRADEQAKTNYIVLDIIKQILEADMAICDLSAKNPNVLYELGIRQAFNKKTLLIKDFKTDFIFDIQGLRTLEYNESLRVDCVSEGIDMIAKGLNETMEAGENEVNSLIQMLAIAPAAVPDKKEISLDTNLILNAIHNISERVNTIEKGNRRSIKYAKHQTMKINLADGSPVAIGEKVFIGNTVYKIIAANSNQIFLKNYITREELSLSYNSEEFLNVTIAPLQ